MNFIFQLYRSYMRAPEHPAKHRIERWLGARLFPEGGHVFTVDKKFRMYLHPNDWIEYLLLKHGKYEPRTLTFMEKNLLPGQTALLAGVNFGLHLMLASRCVSMSGCVIGVEPQPKSLYRTYRNLKVNELPQNIRLVSGALDEKPGLIPMDNAPEHNSGSASLLQSSSSYPFYVHADALDNLLAKLNLNSIDFMLLDVEGYELNVLKGISEKYRPRLLVVEVNPSILEGMGVEQKTLYTFLQSMNYTAWSLEGKPAKPNDSLPEQNLVALQTDARTPQWV